MTDIIDTVAMDTPVGRYRVEFITDQDTEQPYDEGFGLVKMGDHNRIDVATDSALPYAVQRVLGTTGRRDDDERSGAAIVRYLTLRGRKGVTLVTDDYRVDTPSTDRFDTVHGVAWAPDDVPVDRAHDYVESVLRQWYAWSEGDVFGYRVTAPNGDEVSGCSGYYGHLDSREYVLSEARAEVAHDVEQRIDSANRVGAGFVGIV